MYIVQCTTYAVECTNAMYTIYTLSIFCKQTPAQYIEVYTMCERTTVTFYCLNHLFPKLPTLLRKLQELLLFIDCNAYKPNELNTLIT